MTPVNHDYDDILRRALHVAADSLQPSHHGLQPVHPRMRQPVLAPPGAPLLHARPGLAPAVPAPP